MLVHRERMALPPPYADDGPAASDASYFTITEDQLAAEKAVMLALNLPEDSEYISNGKFIKDYTADGITIREGSVISLSETSSTTRSLRNSGKISLKLDISADGDEFPVEYTGMQDGDSIRTETFSGKESYGSTPAAIICSDSKESLENLIKAFVSGTKIPAGFDIVPERSFYDNFQSGKGWIEFRSSAIDESMHKVNFTITGDGITEMMLDGWCISDTNGIRASANPFIREDGAPLSDQEALELSSSLPAFYMYIMVSYPYQEDKTYDNVEWLDEGWQFSLDDLLVPAFFGTPVSVSGTETQENGIEFDLVIGNHKVKLEMNYDWSAKVFIIDGKSYMHLSDKVMQSSVESAAIIRSFWDMLAFALYDEDKTTDSGSFETATEGEYTVYQFNKVTGIGLFVGLVDGELKASEKDFHFDVTLNPRLLGNDNTVRFRGDGYFLDGKAPQFASFEIIDSSHVLSVFELGFYNELYSAMYSYGSIHGF